MNDNYWMAPLGIVGMFLLGVMVIIGTAIEQTRIYNNCLKTNATMAYNEVDKMCKEFVK